MSKCLKCGAALPPVGECPACAAAASKPATPAVPSLLDKEIQIDRRRTPESTPAVSGGPLPSFADLARGPAIPPGMTRARHAAAPQDSSLPQWTQTPSMTPQEDVATQPSTLPAPQRLPTPVPMQATQAAAVPPAMPSPQRRPTPAPVASLQTASDDPDATLPAQPPGAPMARAASDDPDATAPGQPPFAPTPEPTPPTMMAAPVQKEEPPAEPSAQPPGTESATTASRQLPPHVSVVTFTQSRAPSTGLPTPAKAPAAAPNSPRARTGSAPKAEEGIQEIHARPAALWRRLLSFTIDASAIIGVAMIYFFLASAIAGVQTPSAQGLTPLDTLAAWMHALKSVLLPGAFLLLVLSTVYCAVAAFLWNGRTLGRLLLGLRLVDTHGLAPAPTRAIVRALLSVVSFGLFLGGFWMALFDRRGQTLHDKLTSTFVVQPS